ncbi:MAG: glucokinase [Longimicrobiales bacterium]|nr:glucokinase [Longimicrobiales bacterium]
MSRDPTTPAGAAVVADFGGTNARFATVGTEVRDLEGIEVVKCADFASLEDALRHYLRTRAIAEPAEVCIAVAGPVDRDLVDLSNNHWVFSRSGLEASLGAPLTVLNDFTAQALAVDHLSPDEVQWLGAPRPAPGGIRAVIGPGTGLGVAVQTVEGEIIPSEAGHMGFAPASEHEMDLLRALVARYRRVSVERLVSGPGLENLYWANRRLALNDPEADPVRYPPARIAEMAHEGDVLALRSIEDFFDALASFAGDMALATWATGGVYLSGGVVRKLERFLDVERFRARLQDKGRFTRFCEEVAVGWIRAEQPGLLGCAAALRGDARGRVVAPAAAG